MQHEQNIENKLFNEQYRIEIIAKPITLELKRSFNTAHSSSTTRTNFFVKTSIKHSTIHHSLPQNQEASSHSVAIGYGQCGLPPKKPYCYLANIQDCQNLLKEILLGFQEFHQQLKLHLQQKSWVDSSFQKLFDDIFCQHQQSQVQRNQLLWFFKDKFANLNLDQTNQSHSTNQLLFYIQAKQLSDQNHAFKAARNALEFSLLDLIGQIERKSVSQIISGKQQFIQGKNQQNFSFYTISHQEDLQNMLQNGKESLQFTDCIKIKFNNNVQKLIDLLVLMDQEQVGHKWIIDANASWTPTDYIKFQQHFDELINKNDKIKSKVLFIEQPFPIFKSLIGSKTEQDILNEKKEWQQIKQNTSLLIVADESFASCQDIDQVLNYSHGINIKMEKCGGPLQAIKILRQVEKRKIENVMFGSMVSTHLGCTQTFQFHKYATYFDIDGALLVKSPQIGGGFSWKGSEGIKKFHGNGLAMNKLDIQKLF